MSSLRRDYVRETRAKQLLLRVGAHRTAEALTVFWNRRLRTTAGLACYRRKSVFLNPKILEIDVNEVERTLLHELAHFVAGERAGRMRIEPHGREWRQACRDLGIPDEARCHSLPFRQAQQTRKYFYRCGECGTVLARVRKIKRAIACLSCCRQYNGGQYHERFRFRPTEEPSSLAA
ncbi:MAG: SprT-like domain-containing protein [Chthoniobacterales bacterium]